jgi:hypothetical protein
LEEYLTRSDRKLAKMMLQFVYELSLILCSTSQKAEEDKGEDFGISAEDRRKVNVLEENHDSTSGVNGRMN